ncbi:ABC transporter permease [Litorihabitans aurantiacus]|uniref:ABC transporter permease n=1 Tax=Litorihabitans aurantiacus TaxID=1930061 RepID=A0AA37XGL4_9MICO|nr:ABC transporter permease subunit [Litorihabitans aurantiacus]GMA32616.1 ABC transporter permease [Litorihabitans aurantiacus]
MTGPDTGATQFSPPTGWPAAPAPSPSPTPAPTTTRVPRGLTWWGVRTVAVLEARQRLRSTRWKVALGVWFGMVALVTIGLVAVMYQTVATYGGEDVDVMIGRTVFGLILLFVLFLGLLVSPTLSATSINGDRNAGTLAVLQATTLSSWDIAVGKLLASWGAALAFLAASLPFLIWGLAIGGTGVLAAIGAVLMLAVILAVVCAIALAVSSLVTRPAGSAVLTYVVVAALSVGTLIAFGLSTFFVSGQETVRVYGYDYSSGNSDECTWYEQEQTVVHTERTAWMLALNPFVMVADFTPTDDEGRFGDPLSAISAGVRFAQAGAETEVNQCYGESAEATGPGAGTPYWPWSLGAYLAIGAGAVALTARRLAVPTAKLARGTRIA